MPMHADDIAADIQREDRDGLEEAFRALVGWPKVSMILGADAGRRRDLLADVCETLIASENARTMPGDVFADILDEAEDMDGGTYAHGARAVLRCPRIFDRLDREAW